MADTYTQIYVQIVFAVRNRDCMISENHREHLQRFITGIVQKRGSKMISIYCMPNHTHIFIGLNPAFAISDLVRDIKAGSMNFIKEQNWFRLRFSWQEGFGAFSYSKSHISQVARYIENQPAHHKKKTFKEEYLDFLKKFDIDFNEKYLFDWFE